LVLTAKAKTWKFKFVCKIYEFESISFLVKNGLCPKIWWFCVILLLTQWFGSSFSKILVLSFGVTKAKRGSDVNRKNPVVKQLQHCQGVEQIQNPSH
jgi:hypothetical protein